ncbi:MAG: anhydro-N-acetylmuramic acid kinase [Maricaulaceae bacterium]
MKTSSQLSLFGGKLIIGLMSGTSLDGVDAALLTTDGENIESFGASCFVPFSEDEKTVLRETMMQALAWGFKGAPPNIFARAEVITEDIHARAVAKLLKQTGLSPSDIDLIGFHGQTVLHHAPKIGVKGQTLQLGSGQRLADTTGIQTVYDFRSSDVAAGGQGAPLAPIYHKALLARSGFGAETAILNIGGVSNITLMDTGGELFASDCGPGNGPLDQWISKHGLGDYDKDGQTCRKGTPDIARLEGWLQRAFFRQAAPKSADRYDFDVLSSMHGLGAEDGAATLAMFCALGVKDTLDKLCGREETQPTRLIVCGGGRRNPIIMAALRECLRIEITSSDIYSWDGDALEAQAFAYMAERTVRGLPLSFPGTTGAPNAMCGGVITPPAK